MEAIYAYAFKCKQFAWQKQKILDTEYDRYDIVNEHICMKVSALSATIKYYSSFLRAHN